MNTDKTYTSEKEIDNRCDLTKIARIIYDEDGSNPRVAPIISTRNRPNDKGIVYRHGKRRGQLKSCKHKDCNENQ